MPILFKLAVAGQGARRPVLPDHRQHAAVRPARRRSLYFPAKFKLRVLDPVHFDVRPTSRATRGAGSWTSPRRSASSIQEALYEMLRERRVGLVRLMGDAWAGASSSPGSARSGAGASRRPSKRDPDVEVIVGLDTIEPHGRARAHRVRAQPTRTTRSCRRIVKATAGRHDRAHVPRRRLHADGGRSDARDQRHRHHEPVRRRVGARQHGARRRGEVVGARSTAARHEDPYWFREETPRTSTPRTPGRAEPARGRGLRARLRRGQPARQRHPAALLQRARPRHRHAAAARRSSCRSCRRSSASTRASSSSTRTTSCRSILFVLDEPGAGHLQRRRRRPAAVERGGRASAGKRTVPDAAVRHGLGHRAAAPPRLSTCRRELLDLLRYGRGVDNRRLKQAGFHYRYTSAGTVQAFVEALRLRETVGDHHPAYQYEGDVENFFRHSPAVLRDRPRS